MYIKLKQLLIEGLSTGGDPYLTGYRVGVANKHGKLRPRAKFSNDILSKLEKRSSGQSGLPVWKQDPAIEKYSKMRGKTKYIRGNASKDFVKGVRDAS